MVVRDDGTKWACKSCLKGHRVSGCTHTDRELVLVPKKGRPTTQCQHCRQERKKRSAHVKCDCAETDKAHHPKEKCIHLREAEERAKANGFHEDHQEEKDLAYLAAVAEEQGCCCHHGGKCSCAMLKKEDDRDGNLLHGKSAVQKPRLETRKSEGSITVFSNGHHKPVHRKNHAAHESGMPYRVPMLRPHTESSVSRCARRSVDNLTLNTSKNSGGTSGRSSRRNSARRMSKSEHASPKLMGATHGNTGAFLDNDFAAIDFAGLDHVQSNNTMHSALSDNMLPALDPMSGLADYSFDPWSAFPSADTNGMPNNNPFGVWPTNPDTVDLAQPALTAASSGTQSEIDEIPIMEDIFEHGMPSILEDVGATEFHGLMPGNSSQFNRRSLPQNFFGSSGLGMTGWNNEWQTQMTTFDNASSELKTVDNAQSATFDSAWQMPVSPAITDTLHHACGLPPGNSSRSVAHSAPSVNTSTDDLMRSLFPEMDFTNDHTAANNSASESGSVKTSAFPSQLGNAYIVPFGEYQDNDEFTSQPWTDGSMNVPNDPFPSPYAFDQDYSSQDYSPSYIS